MSKILIVGGTGFIGKYLSSFLKNKGYEVKILSRDPSSKKNQTLSASFEIIGFEDLALSSFSCVINLAGAGILDRPWTKKRIKELFDSRVQFSQNLFDKIKSSPNQPSLLINASAIGYYGFWEDQILNESSPFRDCLAHQLCHQWEQSAYASGIEDVSILRFGIVLGRSGGALSRMLPAFKLGLGGPIGHGEQWVSWIHVNDVLQVILKIIEGEIKPQTLNLTAPTPLRQKDFAKTLAKVLYRPSFLPTPAWALKIIFAEGADLLTKGQRVRSKILEDLDYQFEFDDLSKALKEVISGG